MKNRLISALTIILVLASISCSKYEDGPIISFRSKKVRIEGTWKYESIIYVDQNITVTENLPPLEMTFSQQGAYSDNLGYTGTWNFDQSVDLTISKSQDTSSVEEKWEIIRLSKKQLWLRKDLVEHHFNH